MHDPNKQNVHTLAQTLARARTPPHAYVCMTYAQVKTAEGKPLTRLNELEVIKGYVWANVWFDDHLYKIDPVTGLVVDTLNFAELYPAVRFNVFSILQ